MWCGRRGVLHGQMAVLSETDRQEPEIGNRLMYRYPDPNQYQLQKDLVPRSFCLRLRWSVM